MQNRDRRKKEDLQAAPWQEQDAKKELPGNGQVQSKEALQTSGDKERRVPGKVTKAEMG